MTIEEAKAWLAGERSSVNWMQGDSLGEANVNAARYDAAITEQAYWIVRAYRDGLIEEE